MGLTTRACSFFFASASAAASAAFFFAASSARAFTAAGSSIPGNLSNEAEIYQLVNPQQSKFTHYWESKPVRDRNQGQVYNPNQLFGLNVDRENHRLW